MSTRPPAVSGSFYPETKDKLVKVLNDFFNQVGKIKKSNQKPKIVIVPHAGYIYSGKVAAYVYKLLQYYSYSNIILLGPSHFYPLEKPASASFNYWLTPLGEAPVDLSLNKILELPIVNEAFMPEHNLEAQLPFLQYIYKKFTFFPILLNSYDNRLVERLSQLDKSETLFIASSDLSHFLSYQLAVERDSRTIKLILNREERQSREIDACGQGGILTVIALARTFNLEGKLLKYDTSALNSGDYSSVVGYASICFY